MPRGVKIDIEDDGKVFICGVDIEQCQRALEIVNIIGNGPEVGAVYNGIVTRLLEFGAFVEIVPGVEGLVHVSHLDVKRTEKVTDVCNVGDQLMVKVLPVDERGRLNLSRREALIEVEGLVPENTLSDRPRPPRRDFGGDRRGGGRR